jgi:hypothetical protein
VTAQWLPNWNRGFVSVQRSALSTATVVHSEVPLDCVLAEILVDCLNSRKQRADALAAAADGNQRSQRTP